MVSDLVQNTEAHAALLHAQSTAHGTGHGFDAPVSNSAHNDAHHVQALLKTAEARITTQKAQIEALRIFSHTDALTGLANEKGLLEALERDVARTNRARSEGGLLVMFSFENLDSIRDSHGPETADRAVQLVAHGLRGEIRAMDLAARLEVDEFMLLFTDTNMSDIMSRLQNLALRLNRMSFIHRGEEIHVSLSLGLKSYSQGCNAKRILEEAHSDLQRNREEAQDSASPKASGAVAARA